MIHPEDRPNSSRFARIEYARKAYYDKFVKDFVHWPLFDGCTLKFESKKKKKNYAVTLTVTIVGYNLYHQGNF